MVLRQYPCSAGYPQREGHGNETSGYRDVSLSLRLKYSQKSDGGSSLFVTSVPELACNLDLKSGGSRSSETRSYVGISWDLVGKVAKLPGE